MLYSAWETQHNILIGPNAGSNVFILSSLDLINRTGVTITGGRYKADLINDASNYDNF